MGLITEAGFTGYAIALTFAGALFAILKSKDALQSAMAGSMVIGGFAMFGVGLGQRVVDEAVRKVTELPMKVEFLSIGTREADANLLLGGLCVLVVMGVGVAVRALCGGPRSA